jgi:hypothetical protein
MVIIGLVLFVAAAIFGVDLADKNRFVLPRQIEVFGQNLGVNGSGRLFVIGAIVGAALLLGLVMILAGLRRKGAKASARRQERKGVHAQRGELQRLRIENAEMRTRLDRGGDGAGLTGAPRRGADAVD